MFAKTAACCRRGARSRRSGFRLDFAEDGTEIAAALSPSRRQAAYSASSLRRRVFRGTS